MKKLEGKAALITGGGTGVGRAIALALADAGASVAINYSRSRDEAEETASEIRRKGVRALALQADVSREDEIKAMVDKAFAELGRFDMLVNNSGYTQFVPHRELDGLTEEIWDRTLAVNLKGCFFCCREAVRCMLKNGGGSIVSIVGTAGITGLGSSIAYSASKAGILSLTRSLAMCLAPEIQVNAISPGIIEDTRWCKGQDDFNEAGRKATPMKRLATTGDIAEVAVFLFTGSHFITGQNIVVDGGRVIH